MKFKVLVTIVLLVIIIIFSNYAYSEHSLVLQQKTINSNNVINPKALSKAMKAYHKAIKKGIGKKRLLTIVDYTLPSSVPRLWVLDLEKNKIIANTFAAHGKNTGEKNAIYFSNAIGSRKSSLGLYVTGDVYFGRHGKSLRIHGLEKGINDNAFRRNVTIHAANYVSKDYIKKNGRAGRTHGCIGVDQLISNKIIEIIKKGSFVYAYFAK